MIRCDESMKRSKEKASIYRKQIWRCNKDCERCICGMTFDHSHGWWQHYYETERHDK